MRLLLKRSQGEDRRMLEAAERSGVQLQQLIEDLLESTLAAGLPAQLPTQLATQLATRLLTQLPTQLPDRLHPVGVDLPEPAAAPSTRPCRLRPGAPIWPGATLLVVDDAATKRAYLRDICEDWGYRVIEAADGAAALAICAAAAPPIDAVLVDQFMPVLDGWGLLERLRSTPALVALPVLLISAGRPQRPAGLAPQVDFDAWVGKPLDELALKCFLCRHVGHPDAATGACRYSSDPADPAGVQHRADTAVPALAAEDLAVLNGLLDLGRLFAIEDWAHALGARDPGHAGFVERVLRHCRQGNVAGLESLAAALTAAAASAPESAG
jgi:two-component system chemotaxis response regulator CheY